MNRRNAISLTLLLAGVATLAVCNLAVERGHAVAPVPLSQLGLAVDHAEQAQPIAAQMPTFFVVGAEGEDNARKNVRLWDWVKVANGGQHTPNYPQETGDCVSFGAKNACEYFVGAAIGKGILDSEFHPIYPPYIYGGSRVIVGKGRLGRSAGSVGAWAAEWVAKQGGVLRSDVEGVPPYSGKVADEWGYKGPPKNLIEAAKTFTFNTVAPVRSAKDVRDAICNGYPVTIASDFGTTKIVVKDGRRVAVRNTKWYHQMCLVAYDGSGSQPLYYCVNSWGENAHPAPLQGEPPGGFWMTENDVEYCVRQDDSYAYSGFDGFPANEFIPDFTVIGAAGPTLPVTSSETPAMFPLSPDVQLPGTLFGVALLIAALIVFLRGNGVGRLGVVALAAAILLPSIANAQESCPVDFQTLVVASTAHSEMTPVRSEVIINPMFSALVRAAEEPCPVEFSVLTEAATEPKKPAVKPSKAALERLIKSVDVVPTCECERCDCEHCRCGTPVKEPPKPSVITIAAAPNYGASSFQWLSDGRYHTTPEPGTNYPTLGGVLIPASSTKSVTVSQLVYQSGCPGGRCPVPQRRR